MAGRRLRLTKYEVTNVNHQYLGAARLKVVATDPENSGADPNVFLFNRRPANPYDGSVFDLFIGVASAADMADFPVGEPDPDAAYPIFRENEFEIDIRTIGLLNETWTLVVEEVGTLLAILDRLELLVPTVTVDLGTAVDSDSSGSSTSSESGG